MELGNDRLGNVRWYRKADPDTAAAGRVDRGVDADHLALHIKRRPSRIAAIDRRIDLQEIIELAGMDVAPTRRDDPGGDAAAEAERIADRDHPVADLSGAAVAESDIGQRLVRRDSQHREIGARVAADNLGRVLAVVLEDDLDLRRLADHVVVGDDDTGGVNDEARAEGNPLGAPLLGRALGKPARAGLAAATLVEEAPQIILERRTAERFRQLIQGHIGTGLFRHRNVDHRGQHPLHQRRETLLRQQPGRRGRRFARGRRILGPQRR